MRFRAIADFFRDLLDGDPVPWIIVSIVAALLAFIGFFWWRGRVEERRYEEERRPKKPVKKDKR